MALIGDAGYNRFSSGFGYEFRALESASINGAVIPKKSLARLRRCARVYTTIFNMGSSSQIVVILSTIFPSRFVQSSPPKRARCVSY